MSSLWASRRIVTTAPAVSLATLATAACGGGSDTPRPPKTASGRPATIGLESADSLGKVLVDSRGRTLYLGNAKPCDTNGQRATAFGAAWFAVSGAGQVVSRPGSKPGGGGIW
jgi:hypothetical protein